MIRILTLVVLVLCAATSMAEQVVQIYRAESLVASQSTKERQEAIRKSFGEVILRVSGDRDALLNPTVRQALKQAQNYLYEFSYASTDKKLVIGDKQVPTSLLVLKFSPQAVEKLLRDANLPLWPSNRPKLLVWQVMTDSNGNMNRVPDESVREALYAQATLWGLPLLLPFYDLEDNLAISAEDLWNMDEQGIKNASERYRPDAILVGRYRQDNSGKWRSSWQLVHASGNQRFDLAGAEAPGLFAQALDTVATYFARLYAIVPRDEGPNAVIVRINDIRTFEAYKKVLKYLEGLAMVSNVDLIDAEQSRLLVRLHTESDISLLLSTLELGKKLFPVVSESLPIQQVNPHRPDAASPTWQTTEAAPAGQDTSLNNSTVESNPYDSARGSMANPLIYRWQN